MKWTSALQGNSYLGRLFQRRFACDFHFGRWVGTSVANKVARPGPISKESDNGIIDAGRANDLFG
jgi:hypothetical protein